MKLARTLIQAALLAPMLAVSRLASAAPAEEDGWGLPVDASLHGHEIDSLLFWTAIFVTILFVIMCVWMWIACTKHGPDHTPDYDHGDTKHHVVTALAVSAIIFLIVDGNLFINSILDTNRYYWNWKTPSEAPDVVRVEVNAHQWAWGIRHEGADGKFNTPDDIVTTNDMRVPVDRPVLMQIAASDVLHSFNLPNMRVKMDAVPGTINFMTFHPVKPGEYDIGCAQHCGMAHYLMKGQLTVMESDEYEEWVKFASRKAELAHDPSDTEAQWGWDWEDML